MNRKLRMGMVGGGPGAFIGDIHRKAACLAGGIELVCGAFSSDPKKSRTMGKELFLDSKRVYDSYEDMMSSEKSLPPSERMDFVSIVTPNHLHFPVAERALESGFPVICDKPLTVNLVHARELAVIAKEKMLPFAVTYVYSGYPMVKEAKQRISNGDLGEIRKVVVSYTQGWLATLLERENQKQALWRMDPEKEGIAGCMADIGTHAEHLVRYVTGLEITELCADLHISVPGRKVYDDGDVLLHFANGANGLLSVSQVASGEENNLIISVYGEKAGLEWKQQEPNTLVIKRNNAPAEYIRTGLNSPGTGKHSRSAMILPAGHPEGFIEAFADIYRSFACGLLRTAGGYDYPTVNDGAAGIAFLEAALASAKSRQKWLKVQA
ncbi:MAG: Gfo/Idh/MocA family oxidoreductase [Spirochaetes bacterium]|nr:Gfo/Idh/MocA family oxidoreductase [Spirochaetota bacterium]